MRKVLRPIRGGFRWSIIGPFNETLASGNIAGNKTAAIAEARAMERRLARQNDSMRIEFSPDQKKRFGAGKWNHKDLFR